MSLSLPGGFRFVSPLRDGARRLLDLVLPPRCLSCGEEVGVAGALCAGCWQGISFIAAPHCARCGLPFDYDPTGEGTGNLVCGACLARPPNFDRCRSVFAYDDASRSLLLGFKHGDRTDCAPAFAQWLARAGAGLLADGDVIIAPVPLHRWRLLKRRYNQSALLALELGRLTGRPVLPDLLIRRRATPSQGGLTAKGRARNVEGAFVLNPRWRDKAKDARILLVDDVFTTGATVGECARALRRGGVRAVDVLTLARVVRPVILDEVGEAG
ncbi:double zinc ribbon domain-containing protein [Niveispirillum sp. KHB5.9]|uniref:double zinc ribbon domain-containing protein n=1 Tax=Niveispirillum sp. KHB5.9 TaxID=3400269 RepID=UPI003A847FF1